MGYNVESCLFNVKVILCCACTDLILSRQVTVEVLLIQLVLCHCQNAGTAAEPSKSLGTRLREMTFLNFASLEYDGNVYMTPDDFLESIIDDKPRCKPGSSIFSDILCTCVVGLPPILFLSGCPIFWPLCPMSRHNRGQDASYPVFQCYPVLGAHNIAWNGNVWYFALSQ